MSSSEQKVILVKAKEKDPSLLDDPISSALDLKKMRRSGKATEAMLGQILAEVRHIKLRLEMIEKVDGKSDGRRCAPSLG